MSADSRRLNQRATAIAELCVADASRFRIGVHRLDGARLLDFGITARGGLEAGCALSNICLAGLGQVKIESGRIGELIWPHVTVHTDHPLEACLLSQYAGWQIAVGKYFAMGSGPMRATAAVEPIFTEFDYREPCDFNDRYVGVLETGMVPDQDVIAWIVEKLAITSDQLILCLARTASLAGTTQVVARSVETALHKLHELKFDVRRVVSGFGTAPLPPVASHDMAGIGLTNDAILYGGSATLWVTGDDDSLAEVGPRVPSSASAAYGQPFLNIFDAAGRDFYKIDPLLFSPAQVTFCNLTSGRIHRFGDLNDEVLKRSFGI